MSLLRRIAHHLIRNPNSSDAPLQSDVQNAAPNVRYENAHLYLALLAMSSEIALSLRKEAGIARNFVA